MCEEVLDEFCAHERGEGREVESLEGFRTKLAVGCSTICNWMPCCWAASVWAPHSEAAFDESSYGFVSPSSFASWASSILTGRSLGRVQFLKRCGTTA